MLTAFLNRLRGLLSRRKDRPQGMSRPETPVNAQTKNAGQYKVDDFMDRKSQSMQDSQGVSDFSGSSYNGPGNVDREKRHSNMNQRNF